MLFNLISNVKNIFFVVLTKFLPSSLIRGLTAVSFICVGLFILISLYIQLIGWDTGMYCLNLGICDNELLQFIQQIINNLLSWPIDLGNFALSLAFISKDDEDTFVDYEPTDEDFNYVEEFNNPIVDYNFDEDNYNFEEVTFEEEVTFDSFESLKDIEETSDVVTAAAAITAITIFAPNHEELKEEEEKEQTEKTESSMELEFVLKIPGVLWRSKGQTRLIFDEILKLTNESECLNFEPSTVDPIIGKIQNLIDILNNPYPKGYVNDVNLDKVPVIGDVYRTFFDMNAKKSVKLGSGQVIWVKKYKWDDRVFNNDRNYELYEHILRWSRNLVILHLLLITIELSTRVKESDILYDIKYLEGELLNSLDNSIRLKLRKRGISITQSIYCGFDTEYTQKDALTNKLLSVQHALSTQSTVRIPIEYAYDFRSVNTHTGEQYPYNFHFTDFNTSYIESTIRASISRFRTIKFEEFDSSVNKLVTYLKKQVTYKVDEDKGNWYFFLPNSRVLQYFERTDTYSLENIVENSLNIVDSDINQDLESLYKLLERAYKSDIKPVNLSEVKVEGVQNLDKLSTITTLASERREITEKSSDKSDLEKVSEVLFKGYKQDWKNLFTAGKIGVNIKKEMYLLIHHTPADLSILSDFESFKDKLDIVNKSFLNLGRPLKVKGLHVKIRDTMLLSPAANKSLEALGGLYPEANISKIVLPEGRIEAMDKFWEENPSLFKEYALQDALITLIHGCRMAQFNLEIGGMGIPVTLTSLGQKYLLNNWKTIGYKGYQPSPEYLLGDVALSQTPKGLFALGELGFKLNNYIANFKGGRNESFMYGKDSETKWYDIDIVSAYTSVMSMLGDPDYNQLKVLSRGELESMSKEDILYSYIIISSEFKFPSSVKYPSIGCFIDDVTTIYPLEGEAHLTGSEYLAARDQGCHFNIREIIYIPFKKVVENEDSYLGAESEAEAEALKIIKALKLETEAEAEADAADSKKYLKIFLPTIKELQRLRKLHPKKSVLNVLYKQIGNSLYGLTARGITMKKKFDTKLGKPVKLDVTALSNPVICSWITSFIRSLIGELLDFISKIDGSYVVSVTTDGFITNISDLEEKALNASEGQFSLLKEYRKVRLELTEDQSKGYSGDPTALELKTSNQTDSSGLPTVKDSTEGVLNIKTRVQISGTHIVALTGLQRRNQTSHGELESMLTSTLHSEHRYMEHLITGLRSATDIYKHGGQVTPIYKDQSFSLTYDNKRRILDTVALKPSLRDSVPIRSATECKLYRLLAGRSSTSYMNQLYVGIRDVKKYKNKLELSVRNFIKGLFNGDFGFASDLINYEQIISFFKLYKGTKVSNIYLAQLRRRKGTRVKVPKNIETLEFVEFIKTSFKIEDPEGFEKAFFI